MTLLTCEKCQTQYNLSPEQIGEGRNVRCVSCGHTWYVAGEAPVPAAADEALPSTEAENAKSIQESIDALLKQEEAEAAEKAAEAVAAAAVEESEAGPAAVSRVIINYNPFGIGAYGFGVLVFVLLVSVTLILGITARGTVAQHFPRTMALYKLAGFSPPPPGWNLRIEDLSAEQRVDAGAGGVLVVSGKITNMRKNAAHYPDLVVELRSRRRTVVKKLEIPAADTKIASGESAPILLQLKEVPREVSTVSVKVSDD